MGSTAYPLILLTFTSVLSSTAFGFNITRILSNYPDLSTFNALLTQTGLAQQINSRQTITILAVNNGDIGGLSGKPNDVIKRILSAHVVLDYYDLPKLQNIQKKSTILTTLYQTTGTADGQQGFLNVTNTREGIMFGSAVKAAPLTASLEGSVASQPYNISVLRVSSVIEVPAVENKALPKKAPAPAPAPASAKSPAEAPAPVAEEPAADAAPTPAADAPDADAPVSSPPESNSVPADETPAAAPAHSSSSSLHVVVTAAGMGLVACIMAL